MKKLFLISLILMMNGKFTFAQNPQLWGTSSGATVGTIFKINGDGTGFSVMYFFSCATGCLPNGTLIMATDGKFYGTTSSGGTYGWGVIFSFDPVSGIYTDVHDFNPFPDGAYPQSSLIQATNGKIYGMTSTGGTIGNGIIFSYDPSTGNYNIVHDFTVFGYPYVALIQSGSFLYGLTSGASGCLFSLDISTNAFANLHTYSDPTGMLPHGSLIQATNNKIYGTMASGGAHMSGVIFSFDTASNAYTDIYDFDSISFNTGCNPYGSVVQANNSKFYGLALIGGSLNYDGVIFSYDPILNSYSDEFDFTYVNGSSPFHNSLIQASNNKLYGMVYRGGTDSLGVIFSFDPSNNLYTKLLDFNGTNGSSPIGDLLEVNTTGINEILTDQNQLTVTPSPAKDVITITFKSLNNNDHTLKISDITGRIIYKSINQSSKFNIDISSFSSGIYFVQVENVVRNFVKE